MKSTIKFATVIGIAAATVVGCFRSSDSPTVPAVEYDVGPELALSLGDSNVQITPDGTTAIDKSQWPEDVPILADASFTLTSHLPDGQFASYHSASSVDELRRFYAEQFAVDGWESEQDNSSGESTAITGTKAGRKLVVFIEENGTETKITLSHRRNRASGER